MRTNARHPNQILLGQRQDRNLGDVDLLVAREGQQNVDRAFETGDVDHQFFAGGNFRAAGIFLELIDAIDHLNAIPPDR